MWADLIALRQLEARVAKIEATLAERSRIESERAVNQIIELLAEARVKYPLLDPNEQFELTKLQNEELFRNIQVMHGGKR